MPMRYGFSSHGTIDLAPVRAGLAGQEIDVLVECMTASMTCSRQVAAAWVGMAKAGISLHAAAEVA
jgi:hypothetical protein